MAVTWEYTLTDSLTGAVIPGAVVWLSSDIDGLGVFESGITDSTGKVTFTAVSAGDVYVWATKQGYDFLNPNAKTIGAGGGSDSGTATRTVQPVVATLTVSDLITRALRLLDVVGMGETAESELMQDALITLNEMLESWRIDRTLVYSVKRSLFAIQSGVQEYTIGPGATWDTARPPRIEAVGLIINNTGGQTIELPIEYITNQRWRAIAVKSVTSTLPRSLYYDNGNPIATCSLWPVPTDAANQIALYLWDEIVGFSSLSDLIMLPYGYSRAIRYNLAIELNADYRKKIDETTLAMAINSKADLKRLNDPMYELTVDAALLQSSKGFNWRTGDMYR